MKVFTNQAAQGDILVTRVASLPNGVVRLLNEGIGPSASTRNVLYQAQDTSAYAVIAHSETGHHHCLDADRVEMYRLPEEIYECFLVVKEPTPLVHLRPFDTHESIMFEPGIYRVNRQREHTPQGMRRVED